MLRKLICTGWCGRVYINTNGLPCEVVLRCFLRQKCELCQNTIFVPQPYAQVYPAPTRAPQLPPPLSSYKQYKRLYKKLKARGAQTLSSKLENAKPYFDEYEVSDEEAEPDDDCVIACDDMPSEDDDPMDEDEPKETAQQTEPEEDELSAASEEANLEDELVQNGGSWEPPCCCICGETTNSIFCRECSNYIRTRARPLVFFYK